ncbi:putative bifunctional diguanylate cyclase/phosphodiesterase [Piscinibacter sp.]|uniref:putative bifunctional diguanylate cyclase/phosphodiesterase n=1 Tax=Piscinibacter sp. TaxID=1903157 RepID=UPI003D145F63
MSSLSAPKPSWRSPRLGVRLALGFGALVAFVVVVVMLAAAQLTTLARHGEQLVSEDLQRMLKVQEVDRHVQGHGVAMARLLTAARSERERIYPMVDAENAAVDALIAQLSSHTGDAETRALLADLASLRRHYGDVFIDVVTEIEAGDVAKAGRLFDGEGQLAMRAVLNASDALLRHEQTVLASRQQQVREQIEGTQRRLALLALAVVGLSIVLAWRTTISVTRPLSRVEQAADRIARGDYKARVAATSDDELGRVAQAMNAMADAVAAREAQLEGVAYTDRLTGLPNRSMLRRQVREGGWASEGFAVILMDVARLRTVNEVLGFETGDMLLVAVAKRLQAAVAAEPGASGRTTLARLPGGVFAVLCEGRARAAMEAVRERLDAQLAKALACDGHAVDVNLVFGLAEGQPAAGDAEERVRALDSVLQGAELAIAEAKRLKLAWAWHTPTDGHSRTRQLSLLSDLRRAATEGELEMWLQPKQCLRRGRTLGMEGLVRWRHPQRGYISPAEFIPFAERTGHIGVVTTAMLEAALATLAGWSSRHPELSLAVNVSALDVRDPGFVSQVEQMARRHRAPLSRLRLEITESSVMEDADRVLPVLHGLRALGVQLSIDDFGTGYSSLAYLQRLPVSELKIDRSFVAGADRSVEARALLRTIIDLGHSLKMIVTAEGVERTEERDLLIELGCDQAQGYLISRPLAPDAARQYIGAAAAEPKRVAAA